MYHFNFPGWHLLGRFPEGDDDGVGSWLLHHGNEALLLEVPPGLDVAAVRAGLEQLGASLRYATVSHSHWDHWDEPAWHALRAAFRGTEFIEPWNLRASSDGLLLLAGEPVWLIAAPKHSADDMVTVFRGVAMTGDLELGTLDSVTEEVPASIRRNSFRWLRRFPERERYHVHTTVSAHLNSVRHDLNWPELFPVS